ncbi:hypothetical protein Tco_1443406, partial [Tanacetum coccineum]
YHLSAKFRLQPRLLQMRMLKDIEIPMSSGQTVEGNRNARKRLTTTPSNTPVEVTQLPTPTTRPLHPSNTMRSHLMTDETSIPVFKISEHFRNMNTDKLQSGSMKCKAASCGTETLEPKDDIPWWTMFVF